MTKQECVVLIPGLNEKRRFLIPDNMPFVEGIHLMVELIKEDYPESYCREVELDLYKASTGEVLDKKRSWRELDLMEQDELILG